jgi:thioesterase-3
LKPVFTMEDIVFESQLISFTPRGIQVEMRMWNKEKTVLKSIAWFRFVPFNLRKNQVSQHAQKYMELFEKVVLPVAEKTFDERELFFRKNKP